MGKIQQIVQRFHRQILAYVVTQEEERVQAEAAQRQITPEEWRAYVKSQEDAHRPLDGAS